MPEASSSCPSDRRPDRQTARTAACAGLPPKAVFSKKVKEAAPVLRACARCPVRRECERIVAPADNWFDGVCGGRLYRSGRPVEIPAHLMPTAPTGPAASAALTVPTVPTAPAAPTTPTTPTAPTAPTALTVPTAPAAPTVLTAPTTPITSAALTASAAPAVRTGLTASAVPTARTGLIALAAPTARSARSVRPALSTTHASRGGSLA
ncbi:WhiB family transcriptional regulator [Streptomyces sp. NPDC050528]|uniref:WhiB family transcriptional regulator n=1 Tax=Streptomyces sp. NPDC050528 TaxID=3365623 RepID=UPI0037934CC9